MAHPLRFLQRVGPGVNWLFSDARAVRLRRHNFHLPRRLADEVSDVVRLSVVIWEHEPLFAHTGRPVNSCAALVD